MRKTRTQTKKFCLTRYIVCSKKSISIAICVVFIFILLWQSVPVKYTKKYVDLIWISLLLLWSIIAVKINLSEKIQKKFFYVLMLGAPALCFYNTELLAKNSILDMEFLMVVLNYSVYLMIFFVVYAITNRIQAAMFLGMTIFTVYALVNSFVLEFRGNGVRANDIFALRTAINVSSHYSLEFTKYRVTIIFWALIVVLVSFHCNYRSKRVKSRIYVIGGMLCYVFGLYSIFWNDEFLDEYDVKPYTWEIDESVKKHGVLLELSAGMPYLSIEKPEGYSADAAQKIMQEYIGKIGNELTIETGLQGQKPDIIVIMNESFADLGILGYLETDVGYLDNFYSYNENVIRGYASVPVFGGLTANTEFEFITGFSNAFFPTGSVPYQNYVKESTPNLNKWLQEQGYYSIFMHPMDSSGWNRRSVYQIFGFDETYYLDDWENEELLRGWMSDRGNYKEVIQRYEDAKEENDNIFMFNVTMQNHGGYLLGGTSQVQITNMSQEYLLAEQYLSLIHDSDMAFQEMISYFSAKENPVLICMFGDHLPSVEEEFYDELQDGSKDDDLVKKAKMYCTPFIIYSNFEMEEKVYNNISINYLQLLLMEAADLQMNEYQQFLRGLFTEYPVVSSHGTMDFAGNWYSWKRAQNFKDIKDYSIVQYRELFNFKGGGH